MTMLRHHHHYHCHHRHHDHETDRAAAESGPLKLVEVEEGARQGAAPVVGDYKDLIIIWIVMTTMNNDYVCNCGPSDQIVMMIMIIMMRTMVIMMMLMTIIMTKTSGLESFVALLFAETVNTSLALPSDSCDNAGGF